MSLGAVFNSSIVWGCHLHDKKVIVARVNSGMICKPFVLEEQRFFVG